MLLNLVPGQRYEFALATNSHNVSSTKLQRSIAIMPAFDVKGFGLTVQEIQSGIEIIWPQSDAFLARLKDLWNKVGPSSMNSRIRHFYIPISVGRHGQRTSLARHSNDYKQQPTGEDYCSGGNAAQEPTTRCVVVEERSLLQGMQCARLFWNNS